MKSTNPMDAVNPEIQQLLKSDSKHFTAQFNNASPFEHIQLDDFLATGFCQDLLSEFPSFDNNLALNENGEVGKKAVHERMVDLGGSYQKLDQLVQSQDFINMVSNITGIPYLRYDKHYFGGGTHENLHGQGLDPHVDFTHHPVTGYYRRLNLIIYLNKEWSDGWGGCIELHKNPYDRPEEDEIIGIAPLINRAVIFATHHHSWHGFKPIDLPINKRHVSRKSIALYYYTQEKPDWFKRAHSTIYVDRHMSPSIQADTNLSAKDLTEIKRLFAARDQHIQRLYKTISFQMDELNKIKKVFGPLWKLSWPLRKIRRFFIKR